MRSGNIGLHGFCHLFHLPLTNSQISAKMNTAGAGFTELNLKIIVNRNVCHEIAWLSKV